MIRLIRFFASEIIHSHFSSRLQVSFQRTVVEDMRGTNGRQRTKARLVKSDALDLGGLLVEWLDDFFEALKTHTIRIDEFVPHRTSPCEALDFASSDSVQFPPFTSLGNACHFLPSRLTDASSGKHVSLTTPVQNKAADSQRRSLLSLYECVGKILNQMLREDIAIPEAFSSPLLINFLLFGVDGLRHEMTCEELYEALLSVEFDTYGLAGSPIQLEIAALKASPSYGSQMLFDNVVMVHVIEPRLEALTAMKKGFDLVPISDLLKKIPYQTFCRYFVAKASATPQELLSAMDFSGQMSVFEDKVRAAILLLDPAECMELLKFTSGNSQFNSQLKIKVMAKAISESGMLTHYPEFPLATSLTCCNQLAIPFPCEDLVCDAHNFSALSAQFSPKNIRENLLFSFANGNSSHGEFSDKVAL